MNDLIAISISTNNYIPVKFLIEKTTNKKIFMSYSESKQILSLGEKYSPKGIDDQFKYDLGNNIMALDNKANILINTSSSSNSSLRKELQEEILDSLGYEFQFIDITTRNYISIIKLYNIAREINPKINIISYIYYVIQFFLMNHFINRISKHTAGKENHNKNYITILKQYNQRNLSIIKIIKIYFSYLKQNY